VARWSAGLAVSADGTGVVAHAGNVATRLLADQVGLTGALSSAMARRGFTPGHDRGRVLTDVAVLIAGGGVAIADINTLRHQREVLGSRIRHAKDSGIGRFPSREFADQRGLPKHAGRDLDRGRPHRLATSPCPAAHPEGV